MNRLPATVVAVERAGSVALVDVDAGGRRFTSLAMGGTDDWQPGDAVELLFQEAEVSLARGLSGQLSVRNRLPGTITALERGRLLARVTFEMDGLPIGAVITARSCAALGLEVGAEVEGLVKANEMSLVARGAP